MRKSYFGAEFDEQSDRVLLFSAAGYGQQILRPSVEAVYIDLAPVRDEGTDDFEMTVVRGDAQGKAGNADVIRKIGIGSGLEGSGNAGKVTGAQGSDQLVGRSHHQCGKLLGEPTRQLSSNFPDRRKGESILGIRPAVPGIRR